MKRQYFSVVAIFLQEYKRNIKMVYAKLIPSPLKTKKYRMEFF